MPMLKVIHIAKSLKKANLTNQNLSKSMPLPTLQTDRKIMYENTTMCIKNKRYSSIKVCSPFEHSCKLRDMCFEFTYFLYIKRDFYYIK